MGGGTAPPPVTVEHRRVRQEVQRGGLQRDVAQRPDGRQRDEAVRASSADGSCCGLMTSVVPYRGGANDGGVVRATRDWIELLGPAAELARTVTGTEFVPAALRRNPAAITAAILYGDEIGLGPMQSLSKVHIIDGRPTIAAET